MVNLKKSFSDALEFTNNKVCLVRIDLNLPIVDHKFSDLTRLISVLPTIKALQKRNSKIVLMSHLGRPNGKYFEELSLRAITKHLEENLESEILFSNEQIESSKLEKKIKSISPGQILLLENMRFYEEEEKNDENFSKKLSSYGDIFINESFSSSHRKHASTYGVAKFLPSFPGKLLEYELKNLNKIIKNIDSISSIAVLGGSKVSTKIDIINNLLNKFNKILIGGAMANTFLASKGIKIGKSMIEPKLISDAKQILKNAKNRIILPIDATVTENIEADNYSTVDINNVKENQIILDIGPKTRKNFYNEISKYNKLLWNGPLGYFEKEPFNNGTNYVSSVVKKQSKSNMFSVAGGGDTISALKKSENIDKFSFISTGGGAFLEFIEGRILPGIDILNK